MYYAALDLSGNEAFFAITDKNYTVLINEHKPFTGRTSSQLTPWLIELLERENISLKNIEKWTIGSGPGSFTGLRLVASLVSGLCFGRKNVARCVPSAIAITGALPSKKITSLKNNDKVAVYFNGFNNELLLFSLQFKHGNLHPIDNGELVLNNESFNSINDGILISPYDNNKTLNFDFSLSICLSKDYEQIKAIMPAEQLSNIIKIDSLNIISLIKNSTIEFDNNLSKLEYIRPAAYK
ncbi:hypothetical protein AAEX28_10765 [Lentisphaerota bacterium WC36G]|nr:hypothetical protein LJT99_13610 [Lentisphaerae bacterium WC36]